MRVIAGSAKRLQLKSIEGMDTRPTTDRIKETLFNMISTDLADWRFLDLFSGSGAIGIEALSRGADIAYFVENHPKAADCIKQNLRHTRLEERAVLMRMDVLSALRKLEGEDSFDIIFMDPPYHIGAERGVFDFLKHSGLVNENTLIIVEASLGTDFSWMEDLGFHVMKEKKYKTNRHIFVERD